MYGFQNTLSEILKLEGSLQTCYVDNSKSRYYTVNDVQVFRKNQLVIYITLYNFYYLFIFDLF